MWVCYSTLVKDLPTQPCENKRFGSLPHHDWRTCLKGHRPFIKPPAPCGGENITVWCICCISNNSPLFWDRLAAGRATLLWNMAQGCAPPDPHVWRPQSHVRQEPPCLARFRAVGNLRLRQLWWRRAGCIGLIRVMRLITTEMWVCYSTLVKDLPIQPCENKRFGSLPHHDWRTCLKGHKPFIRPPAPCGGESTTVWCICCISINLYKYISK